MEHLITDVGLDVHKGTIAAAAAGTGQRGEVREYGKIGNTPAALRTLVAKLTNGGNALRLWKALERLCRRYRKLVQAGSPTRVVIAAVARELSGFVWAIAKQATPTRA